MNKKQTNLLKKLEYFYETLNKPEFIHPDPLEFIFKYENQKDREIVGLIASALAYGKVAQILKSVEKVLKILGTSPSSFLLSTTFKQLKDNLSTFKHRFTTGIEMADFLWNIRKILTKYGSLENCFLNSYSKENKTVQEALSGFAKSLRNPDGPNSLIPSPERGSACKRLHLFLRWMIRNDDVDPGCWKTIPPSKLIVPLDTHMFNIGKTLKFTKRNAANLKTAIEITNCFKKISADDPVKYDFCLTRLGIRNELTMDLLTKSQDPR